MKKIIGKEEITETISHMIEDRILVCNSQGKILFSNRAMCAYLGYGESELQEKHILDIIEKNYIDRVKSIMKKPQEQPSDWQEFLLRGRGATKKLPLRFSRQKELLYIHGNEKYMEYERMRRKLDIEVKNAMKIHQQALPKTLPDTEKLSFSFLHLPAEELGGDIFDAFKVDNGLLDDYFEQYVCFIADVSGHGLDSAMLSIFIKDTIRSYFKLKHVPGQVLSPKEILHFLVEQYIKEGYPDEYLVCLFIAVFDVNTKELTYSAAGFHEPPFFIREGNEIMELDEGGMPISAGIDREWLKYEDTSVSLSPGITLFMMSDGLPEQRGDNQCYDYRFKRLVEEIHSLRPGEITDKVQADFRDHVKHRKVEDDITLVVAQLT
ncbi:SpoIIE family protein phosphatase [Isachenkonia alkalipeptolytica]|uniref:PAS domain S-box protein n=1 Tax=Isachenkonia alkalipeptolytica TaxID=2565777 RepID=A0AA43XJR7_9CLOT|nr:SpoIIE family protein phosphatase [Isachenkonia alkalipeptolytica]NBG88180.1 PAS domain S-box protein [Isachenkonia alkalipeptolytica]